MLMLIASVINYSENTNFGEYRAEPVKKPKQSRSITQTHND